MRDFQRIRRSFPLGAGGTGSLYSLPELEKDGLPGVGRLPVSIRIVLESLLRNCDGKRVKEDDVRALAAWKPKAERTAEVPFVVARIVLQDFTGVPAAGGSGRDALGRHGARRGSRADRAPRPGRARRRPLGPGRRVVHAGRACRQHAHRVPAQPRALRVPEVGHAGVPGLRGRAAGNRHRPPGQPRVPRAGRLVEGRRVLPRLARRHRLAHHHDQRARRRRLGRGRHRGRGRDARAARLLPDAGRRRRPPHGQALRGRHRDGPRSHGDRDAAPRQRRRQVRRVLRRGRRLARPHRSGDGREHGARVRRDDGILPGRRGVLQVPARDGPQQGARRHVPQLLHGAGPLRHAAQGRLRLHGGARARSDERAAERLGPEAAAGPDSAAGAQGALPRPVDQARRRERLRQGCSVARPAFPGEARPAAGRAAGARRRSSRRLAREEHERVDGSRDGEQPSDPGPRRRGRPRPR